MTVPVHPISYCIYKELKWLLQVGALAKYLLSQNWPLLQFLAFSMAEDCLLNPVLLQYYSLHSRSHQDYSVCQFLFLILLKF